MALFASNPRRTLVIAALAAAAGTFTISACSTEPNASPDLALALTPTAIAVAQGGTGTSAASIARGGSFTGAVTLSATVPAGSGVSVTFSPALIAAGATTAGINVAVDAAAILGDKTITINAAGSGVASVSKTLTVTVVAPGGGSASVTFCAEDAPIWVAAQDGTGAWTRVTPTSGSTYQFTFATGKGGVATVDTVGAGTDLNVIYGTLADFTAFGGTVNNNGCITNKVVNGAVLGVGATQAAIVNLGTSSALVVPPQTGFALNDVPAGLQDLVATRNDIATFDVNWIILRRGLNPPDGFVLPTLTFGTEGFAPVSANVNVTNLGADTATVASLFTGVRGSAFVFLSTIPDYIAATTAQPYAAIPSTQLTASEMQEVLAISSEKDNSRSGRTAGVYFTTVADRTIALGPKLSAPSVTKVVTAPNARPNVQLVSQAEYNRYIGASYSQAGINRAATVFATAGYFGGVPATWNVTLPDLSGAAGWSNTWGLLDGTPIDWDVSAQGGAVTFLDPVIGDGSVSRSAAIQSSLPLSLRAVRSEGDPFAMRRRLLDVLSERNRSPLH